MKDPRSLALAMAAIAVAATGLALWALLLRPAPAPPSPAADAMCDCTQDTAAPPEPPTAPATEPEAPGASPLTRYAVCPREPSAPRWTTLTLWGAERVAIHCGSSVHVVGFDRGAAADRPLRLARIDAPAPEPGTRPQAVAPVAGDVDGDGGDDLVIPMLWVEASGTPRSGALYLLPSSKTGGPSPARRLVEVAADAVALGQLDGHGALELAALHLPGPDLASELWVLSSGPSPRRLSRTSLGRGHGWVAWLDTDGDGREEPLAALRDVPGVRGTKPPTPLPDAGVSPGSLATLAVGRDAAPIALGSDREQSLAVLGERVWLLTRGAGGATATPVEGSEGLRELTAFDVNRDGRADLLGHDGKHVVLLEAKPEGGFFRRQLMTLQAGPFTPLSIAPIQTIDDERVDALVLGESTGADAQVELVVVTGLLNTPSATPADTAVPLPDAALSLRVPLP